MYTLLTSERPIKSERQFILHAAGWSFRLTHPVEGLIVDNGNTRRVRHEPGTRLTSAAKYGSLDRTPATTTAKRLFFDEEGNQVIFDDSDHLAKCGADIMAWDRFTEAARKACHA